jgi:hypothetical protein
MRFARRNGGPLAELKKWPLACFPFPDNDVFKCGTVPRTARLIGLATARSFAYFASQSEEHRGLWTMQDFPRDRTLASLRNAFENAGVEFFDAIPEVRGPGACLKWGVEVTERAPSEDGTVQDDGEGNLKALEAAEDIAAYWAERPEQWAALSDTGRQALSTGIFGDIFAADDAFGHIWLVRFREDGGIVPPKRD